MIYFRNNKYLKTITIGQQYESASTNDGIQPKINPYANVKCKYHFARQLTGNIWVNNAISKAYVY